MLLLLFGGVIVCYCIRIWNLQKEIGWKKRSHCHFPFAGIWMNEYEIYVSLLFETLHPFVSRSHADSLKVKVKECKNRNLDFSNCNWWISRPIPASPTPPTPTGIGSTDESIRRQGGRMVGNTPPRTSKKVLPPLRRQNFLWNRAKSKDFNEFHPFLTKCENFWCQKSAEGKKIPPTSPPPPPLETEPF